MPRASGKRGPSPDNIRSTPEKMARSQYGNSQAPEFEITHSFTDTRTIIAGPNAIEFIVHVEKLRKSSFIAAELSASATKLVFPDVRPELMEAFIGFTYTLDYDIPRLLCRPQLSSLSHYREVYSSHFFELDLHMLGRALGCQTLIEAQRKIVFAKPETQHALTYLNKYAEVSLGLPSDSGFRRRVVGCVARNWNTYSMALRSEAGLKMPSKLAKVMRSYPGFIEEVFTHPSLTTGMVMGEYPLT